MRLEVCITAVDGKTKGIDIYADEVMGLMSTIMSMASAKPSARAGPSRVLPPSGREKREIGGIGG